MHVIHRRGWEIPEHQATPEQRVPEPPRACSAPARDLPPQCSLPGSRTRSASPTFPIRPRISIRPSATRNTGSTTGRSRRKRSTPTTIISTSSARRKNVTKAAQALKIRPWTVKIDGMVEKPFEIAIDDLIRKMPLEERLYRHRCVEAWSMTIPWTGFPMAKLVEAGEAAVVGEIRRDADVPGQRPRPASGRAGIRGPTPKG